MFVFAVIWKKQEIQVLLVHPKRFMAPEMHLMERLSKFEFQITNWLLNQCM